ncbi:MAG: anhydro-N-acetylmuramic acid kinase, partial [Turicibacter sp.]
MQRLLNLVKKEEKLVIGLMSGTSVDGIDTALVKIKGHGLETEVELVAFENYEFPPQTRTQIFELFSEKTSNNEKICHLNFVLGELYTEAVFNICKKAKLDVSEIDLVGSHGQTIYHLPQGKTTDHITVKSTLQIGEGSVIAKKTGIVTINDFRVGDMAVGGLGAPLVPYPEYLLYRSEKETIALQNIGGIGNVTILPANCSVNDVYAFDTGPGNMIIDGVVNLITEGQKTYDDGGVMGSKGCVDANFLAELLNDEYFYLPPPKTTGREYFGV